MALLPAVLLLGGCKPKNRVSVIVITLDTVRADHLSVYGYPRRTTPFLERLAKESVTFNNAYTPIPHTVPAHTSLFTSRYPSDHKLLYNDWKLKDWKLPLLTDALEHQGYQTGAVIASQVLSSSCGLSHGFQFYQDKNFEQPLTVVKKKKKISHAYVQRRAVEVLKWAERWLNDLDRERPFFLWLHFYDAHRPYDFPPELTPAFALDDEFKGYLEKNHYLMPESYADANTYDNELLYLDQNLEKLFGYLKDQGLLAKSLIIVTADHGEGLGQHNLYNHGLYLYEEQVRIPLLIRFADGYKAGTRVDAAVSLIDIAPTILDYLQLKDKMEPRGSSMLGLIAGTAQELRPCQFFERRWYEPKERVKGRKAGARCGDWKVIWADEETNELYDLSADPFELSNIREGQPKKFRELEAEVKGYLELVKFFSVEKQAVPKKVQKELKALGYTQ